MVLVVACAIVIELADAAVEHALSGRLKRRLRRRGILDLKKDVLNAGLREFGLLLRQFVQCEPDAATECGVGRFLDNVVICIK